MENPTETARPELSARLELSAFQINDLCLFTVHYGARKVASGMTKITWPTPSEVQLDGGLTFKVTHFVDDPAVVGKFKNQRRIKLSGFLDFPAAELNAVLALFPEDEKRHGKQ